MVFVFKCILSDAEMIDDSYNMEEDFNGYLYKVQSKYILDPDQEESQDKVNDIVHSFNFLKSEMSKNDFVSYLKGYVKSILT